MELRDSFFNNLYEIIRRDKNCIFLTSDMAALGISRLETELPNQFLNVGISEQNMISVSAGLSKMGKKVFAYTITPFITERCYEQIKVDICIPNFPVVLIGIGSGLTYSYDGATHNTPQDIPLMRSLPNMSVYIPSDPFLHKYLTKIVYKEKGPSYISIDKGDYSNLYNDSQINNGFVECLNGEKDLLIISAGTIMYNVIEVMKELKNKNIGASYLDLYRIKPLNTKGVSNIIKRYEKIVVIEERSCIGGIGGIISEIMMDEKIYKPLKKISLPDEFSNIYGDRNWIRSYYFLDIKSITKTILDWNERGI